MGDEVIIKGWGHYMGDCGHYKRVGIIIGNCGHYKGFVVIAGVVRVTIRGLGPI